MKTKKPLIIPDDMLEPVDLRIVKGSNAPSFALIAAIGILGLVAGVLGLIFGRP